MRRYRRNGTPLGGYVPYMVAPGQNGSSAEVMAIDGAETWEDAYSVFVLERLANTGLVFFGPQMDMGDYGVHRTILDVGSNFSYTVLNRANLRGAVFRGANLIRSDLPDSILDDVEFSGCSMAQANFHRSSLRGCLMMMCETTKADFSSCSLVGARFGACEGTDKADFSYARMSSKDRPPSGWRIEKGILVRGRLHFL